MVKYLNISFQIPNANNLERQAANLRKRVIKRDGRGPASSTIPFIYYTHITPIAVNVERLYTEVAFKPRG